MSLKAFVLRVYITEALGVLAFDRDSLEERVDRAKSLLEEAIKIPMALPPEIRAQLDNDPRIAALMERLRNGDESEITYAFDLETGQIGEAYRYIDGERVLLSPEELQNLERLDEQ